jgi:hypothetical protein
MSSLFRNRIYEVARQMSWMLSAIEPELIFGKVLLTMLVLVNHCELQIESNSIKASCI